MNTLSPAAAAEEWIEKWSGDKAPGVDGSALDWDLPREQPELCLAAIMEVLERIDCSEPSKLLGVLAAGPLEDLLTYSGQIVLDQVDLLARRDSRFRLLLNGVWDSGINPSILARLAKYRTNRW